MVMSNAREGYRTSELSESLDGAEDRQAEGQYLSEFFLQ
jgi:hypothetical protein